MALQGQSPMMEANEPVTLKESSFKKVPNKREEIFATDSSDEENDSLERELTLPADATSQPA